MNQRGLPSLRHPGPRGPASTRSTRGAWLRRFAAGAALVGLCTCDIHLSVSVGGSATIPKATLLGQLLGGVPFGGFDQIDLSEQFQNQGVSKDEVDSVALSSMKLSIVSPQGQTFDFIQSLSFSASADGLPDVEVAHLAAVPKGATELDLDVDPGVDLTPYVVAPSMTLSSHVTGSQPSEDTTLKAAVTIEAGAHLPGCGQ